MARDLLTDAKIKRLQPGEHADGNGLHIRAREAAGGGLRLSWTFQYVSAGKRSRIGLGPYPVVSLAEARARRDALQGARQRGIDPKAFLARQAAVKDAPTVTEAVLAAYERRRQGMKNGTRWLSSLRKHVLPVIGDRDITSVTADELLAVFTPIWTEIPEAASKSLLRLRMAYADCEAAEVPVDVAMLDRVKRLLGSQRRATKGHAAAPLDAAPAIYRDIGDTTTTALALRFALLTASRQSEVRFMGINEVVETTHGWVWTVPAERMKTYQPDREDNPTHRVPLSDEALRIYQAARDKHPASPLAFPGQTPGKPLSDMTLAKLLKKVAAPIHVTVHGTARSTFRDWAAEHAADIPPDVVEIALAHRVGSAVERAYRRTDYLDMRRDLMDRWAGFLTSAK